MASSLENGAAGQARKATTGTRAPAAPGSAQQDVAFLARAIADLSALPLKADIYRRIAELVRECVGNAVVTVQSYDAEAGSLEVRALVGIDGLLDGILSALGGHPVGMSFRPHDEARQRLSTGELVVLKGGVQDLAFGAIPRSICRTLERLVKAREICVLGLTGGSELLGSVAVVPRGGAGHPDPLMLQALVRHASVVLQRRQAMAAHRESEARYRLLAEHATDVVWTSDLHLRFTYVSGSIRHLLGYTPDEMYTIPLRQLLAPASLSAARLALAEELALSRSAPREPGTQRVLELEALRRDGTPIWVEVRAELSCDPEGNPVGILATTHDITDQKRRERERQAHEARVARAERIQHLVRLAASLGGDLTASLDAAAGGVAQALARLSEGSPARAPLARAQDGLKRAAALAGRIRDAGRIAQPSPAEPAVACLLDTTASLLRERLPIGTDVESALGEGVTPPPVDGNALGSALAALAATLASIADEPPRSVKVSVEATDVDAAGLAGSYLESRVAPGPATRLALSMPFPLTEVPSPSEALDGILGNASVTSLECASALGTFQALGAALSLEGGPDQLLLTVLLPPAPLPEAVEGIADDGNGWAGGGTVVVADADVGARWLAKSALEQAGLTVLTAGTTATAVDALRRNRASVSAVLLDAAIPPAGAAAALQDLRAVRPDVAVILSSPFGDEPTRPAEGVAGFVQKPYLPKLLVRALRLVLRG